MHDSPLYPGKSVLPLLGMPVLPCLMAAIPEGLLRRLCALVSLSFRCFIVTELPSELVPAVSPLPVGGPFPSPAHVDRLAATNTSESQADSPPPPLSRSISRPACAMERWAPEHLWNWLRAWCVPAPLTYVLFTAGVDGQQFVSMYWDARLGHFTGALADIVRGLSPDAIDELLKPVMRAGRSAADTDFLLSRGNWVRLVPSTLELSLLCACVPAMAHCL